MSILIKTKIIIYRKKISVFELHRNKNISRRKKKKNKISFFLFIVTSHKTKNKFK